MVESRDRDFTKKKIRDQDSRPENIFDPEQRRHAPKKFGETE